MIPLKYTADKARSWKAYRELPGQTKINEADTFGVEDGVEPIVMILEVMMKLLMASNSPSTLCCKFSEVIVHCLSNN